MTKEREALKLALEALSSGEKMKADGIGWWEYDSRLVKQAIIAIKEALAQPAQEPVGHRVGFWCADLTCNKCYSAEFRFKHTTPQQRPWVGLTEEEVNWFGWHGTDIRAIEDKLKEKNFD